MDTKSVFYLLMGAGVGTYLLRYLPMRWYLTLQTIFERPDLRAVLVTLGPAAIVALLVVSLSGLVGLNTPKVALGQVGPIGLACTVMWIVFRWWRNTILITVIGVFSYGVVLYSQSLFSLSGL